MKYKIDKLKLKKANRIQKENREKLLKIRMENLAFLEHSNMSVQECLGSNDEDFLKINELFVMKMLNIPTFSKILKQSFPDLPNEDLLKIWAFALAYRDYKNLIMVCDYETKDTGGYVQDYIRLTKSKKDKRLDYEQM